MSGALQRIRDVAAPFQESPAWVRIGNWLGTIGALIILGAYASNVLGWMSSEGLIFPGANLIGAGLILFSLIIKWNFPSFFLEGMWFLISLYGLIKAFCACGLS